MASAHPRPSKPPPCGIITVLNTPFTADAGEIDLKSLSNNVERAIDAGVAGFLVPALASEVSKLTAAEREAILRCVARTVASSTIDGPKHEAVSPEGESSGAGTRPAAAAQQPVVIGGASAATGSERMEAAATALDAGADAVLVNIPFNGDEAAWARDVRQVAGVVEAHGRGAWLCVQEWSGSDEGVPVAAIARLYDELPVFRSLKVEVVNATVKYSKLLEACPGLHVAGGWAVQQMIEALDRGVHAFMPTGMHILYTTIYNHHTHGRRREARQLFHLLLPTLCFSNQHLDVSIHFFKRLLCSEGTYATAVVRQPILEFDATQEVVAMELIRETIALQDATYAARESAPAIST